MKKICVSISQADYDYLKSKGQKTFGREHGAVSKSIALLIKEDRQDLDMREVGDKFTVKAEGVYQGNKQVWVPEQDLML